MPGGGEADKYGDFDPTAFRIEEDGGKPAEEGAEVNSGPEMPADHEAEVNPEKREEIETMPERRVSPGEYLNALEKIMTGPERGAIIEKARGILKKLEKLDPEQRAIIIEVLGDTLLELKKASKGLKDYYESVSVLLNQIDGELPKKITFPHHALWHLARI